MNSLQVLRSLRFLYASIGDFALAKRILADQGKEADGRSLLSVSPLGTLPAKAGMPPGISLLASGRTTEHLCPVIEWKQEAGRIRVRVSSEQAKTVEHLLADGPFRSAEVYDTNGPGIGMRRVAIEKLSDEPLQLLIQLDDPALRALMREIDSRR